MKISRDVSFVELQKTFLREMAAILKPEVFSYSTPISEMFKIHLQEPSADPGTYLEANLEHPMLTEMIDLALSVQPSDSGPQHIKLSLEWSQPEKYFNDMEDHLVEHESVSKQQEKSSESNVLTLEHCLDHYTKASRSEHVMTTMFLCNTFNFRPKHFKLKTLGTARAVNDTSRWSRR